MLGVLGVLNVPHKPLARRTLYTYTWLTYPEHIYKYTDIYS